MERIQRLMQLNHIPTNNVAIKEKTKLDEETEKSPQSSPNKKTPQKSLPIATLATNP